MKNHLIKLVSALLISLVMPIHAHAAQPELTINVYFKPGGNGLLVTNMLAEELPKRGWKIDVKQTQNCALTRQTFVDTKDPILTAWEAELLAQPDHACALPLVDKEFVATAYGHSEYLCTNRPDLEAKDLANPNRQFTIGIRKDPVSQWLVDEMITKGKFNLRVIKYDNSSALSNALASGELDLIMGSAGPALVRDKKARCLYVTNDTEVVGAKPIKEISPDFRRANRKNIMYLQARNLSPELRQKLDKDVAEIVASEKWQQFISQRGFHSWSGTAQLPAVKQSILELKP